MADDDVLSRVESGSALLIAVTDDSASLVHRWRERGLTVRRLRGRKMRTLAGLYDEAPAALQFPDYFGENLDALNECMTDLPEWNDPGNGYVVVITDAEEFLRKAQASQAAFAEIVANVQLELSRPIELGEWWDRPAVPFHVVLLCRKGQERGLSSVWSASDHWSSRRIE